MFVSEFATDVSTLLCTAAMLATSVEFVAVSVVVLTFVACSDEICDVSDDDTAPICVFAADTCEFVVDSCAFVLARSVALNCAMLVWQFVLAAVTASLNAAVRCEFWLATAVATLESTYAYVVVFTAATACSALKACCSVVTVCVSASTFAFTTDTCWFVYCDELTVAEFTTKRAEPHHR